MNNLRKILMNNEFFKDNLMKQILSKILLKL